MTVLEGIQKSAEFLASRGVETPRLQAELLLAHQLQLPRMKLYLNFERTLSTPEINGLRESIRRRGAREPLQHIVGSTSFCGLELRVRRDVLIPRPETELLAEAGWTFLNSLASSPAGPPGALDLGTGTGCIAIALATHCPGAAIWATDVAPAALDLARENARELAVADRIRFAAGDGFTSLAAAGPPPTFDLIVSNPPYVPTAEIASLEPEVRDYDPHTALDGGADGLDFFRRLAAEALPFLKSSGRLMLEFGDGQADELSKIFAGQNWIVDAVREDYTHRPRLLIARPGPPQERP